MFANEFTHLNQSLITAVSAGIQELTHLCLDEMTSSLYITFFCAFLWMKSFEFWFKFHQSLFQWVQLTTSDHWLWLGVKQVTIHYLNQCWPSSPTHICSTRGNELIILYHFEAVSLRWSDPTKASRIKLQNPNMVVLADALAPAMITTLANFWWIGGIIQKDWQDFFKSCGTTSFKLSLKYTSMDYCKAAISPLPMYWRYCSLALSHQLNPKNHALFMLWYILQSIVWCCYNAVNFIQYSHNRHPIAHLWRRDMVCLLGV